MRAVRHRGLVTVEMAIILPLFLLLLFGVLDFGRLYFTQITLQHAMREGGRFGVTGQQLEDPNDPGTLQSRIASIKRIVVQSAVGVPVDPTRIEVRRLGGDADEDDAGGPGQTFRISLRYTFVFATPMLGRFFQEGDAHEFQVSTTFRNEPFPPVAGS